MLLNLLSNAIKFTDSGHVLISIEVLGRKEGKVRLRLAVEDTGVGINPEDIPLVYEPYVQLGQRFQRQLPGAGLGLTICRQLVDLMGGSMDLESRPGEGSTFWVELSLPEATRGRLPRCGRILGRCRADGYWSLIPTSCHARLLWRCYPGTMFTLMPCGQPGKH